jgi:hypothetical protein
MNFEEVRILDERFPPPGVYLELDAFGLRDRGPELAEWLDRVVQDLVEPAVGHALLSGGGAHGPLPNTDWTEAAGADVLARQFVAEDLDGEIVDSDPENDWSTLQQELAAGKLWDLRYHVILLGENGYPDEFRGQAFAKVRLASLDDPEAADVLAVLVSRAMYGNDLTEHQPLWVDTCRAAATRFAATTGYLTVDYPSFESPYEQFIGRYWLDGLRECRTHVRGYYWGNLLSTTHVEALGGAARVRAEAPCHFLQELAEGLWFLQLTPDLDDISDEALAALKAYFEPLLPKAEDDWEYAGLPLRV